MAYHMLICNDSPDDDLFLERYLGSATSIDFYWESVGRKLCLPIISAITERADSEEGFVLFAASLIAFKNEMEVFERYWADQSHNTPLPDGFLQGVSEIMDGINNAINKNLTLMIG